MSKKDLEEPPRVPIEVMVRMVRDEDFRKLMKTEPAKAHALLTEAAKKGQKRVGEVLRLAREWKTKPREPIERAVRGVDYVDLEISVKYRALGPDVVRALLMYRDEKNLSDLNAAATDMIFSWIKEQAGVDYVDLSAAFSGILVKHSERYGYLDRALAHLKEEREEAKK